jgi:hypothetical protein
MTLHNEQDAIKQAVEAGYNQRNWDLIRIMDYGQLFEEDIAEILQDPAFWQFLGKAREWDKVVTVKTGIPGVVYDQEATLFWGLKYFETRLSNGDMQAYWESLP